jgi:hypothetical protein
MTESSAIDGRLSAALADRYRIERELGQGGMATVYLAEDLKHRRKVALKVLKPELAAVLGAERFVQEITTTAALQHPHILPLFDSGDARPEGPNGPEGPSFLYYVMPFIDGETLRARLDRETQLGVDEAVRITRDVADALDYAHRHGVIHRDIKPENILLHDGRPVVADFGLALAVSAAAGGRMTETGLSLGTPHYMSPEQATADRTVTARSDIYSLAAVLYEMLSGEPPHMGTSAQQIIMKIVTDVPRRVGELRKAAPANVEAALAKALEKLPADRFTSANAFAAALANPTFGVAARDAVSAASHTSPHAFAPWIRSAWTWGTLAVIAVALPAVWLTRDQSTTPVVQTVRPIRITHSGGVGCASISPDGREFAAVLGAYSEETECIGKLVIRAVPTGVDQELVPKVRNVSQLRWNPSSTMLLMDGGPEDKPNGIWIQSRSGGAPRLLASGNVHAFGFADDRHVFLFRSTGLELIDPTSGEVLDSVPGPRAGAGGRVDWSPDGTRFLMRRAGDHFGFVVMSAKGVATDSIAGTLDAAFWAGPSRVVYYLDRGFGPGDLLTRELDPTTGRFRGPPGVLWAALPAFRDMSSTADGKRVMVVVRAVLDEQHIMPLSASGASRVLVRSRNSYLGDPIFSPDGTRILYSRQDALGFNAYWIAAEGGPEHPITTDTIPTFAEWIDSHRIVTSTGRANVRTEIDLDNGQLRRVADSTHRKLYEYFGGMRIWQRGDSTRLTATDEQGTVLREMGSPPGLAALASHWFPAASYLVLSGRSTEQKLVMVGYSFDLGRWSEPVPLLVPGIRIASGGRDGTIYFSRLGNDRTEIWKSPNYSTAPSLMLTLPVHCYNQSVMVSPDGKSVVCNVTGSEPDAWMINLDDKR